MAQSNSSARSSLEGLSYVPGKIIVRYSSELKADQKIEVRNSLNAKLGTTISMINAEVLEISGMSVEEAIETAKGDPRILYAEPDYVWNSDAIPNDPSFNLLWGMHNTGQSGGTLDADIDAPEAWNIGTGNSVIVGVIDTGVDTAHVDLIGNIWTNPGEIPNNGIDDDWNGYVDDMHGWDFVNSDNGPVDDNIHGTHCSGTIAGKGNNGIGVAGVCWSAKIMALKFLDSGGYGSTSNAVLAIQYAIKNGANLTSNSWGGGSFSLTLKDMIDSSGAHGMLFVAAAGNDWSNNDLFPAYPASYTSENIIAVAATTHDDLLVNEAAWGSNYGLVSVDLGAPGLGIFSTIPGNSYTYLGGTSMATPHVSGACALVWSVYPALTSMQVKSRLLESVDPVTDLAGKCATGGRLNVFMAMAEPDSITPSPITDLAIIKTEGTRATLSWTATGDDSAVGSAAFYDIRYSSVPINSGNFNSATPVNGEPDPQVAGSSESFVVSELSFSTEYYFAIKAADEWGNASVVSNSPSTTTLGPPLMVVTPMSFFDSLFTNGASVEQLDLANSGEGELFFDVLVEYPTLKRATGSIIIPPSSAAISGEAALSPVQRTPVGETNFDLTGDKISVSQRSVLLVYADYGANLMISILQGYPDLGPISTWYAASGGGTIPSLADLQDYDVVVAWNNSRWADMYAIGDVLADYIDQGGAVVTTVDCWSAGDFASHGRYFDDAGYAPFRSLGGALFDSRTLGWFDAGHPVMDGVDSLSISYFYNNTALTAGAVAAARWDDGTPLVATNPRTVSINIWPGDEHVWSGDFPTLIHNAINYAAGAGAWLSVVPDAGEAAPFSNVSLDARFDAENLDGGDYLANIIVNSNDPSNSTDTVEVHLLVTPAADIEVKPDTLDFGIVYLGFPESLPLLVSNKGTDTLWIANVEANTEQFSADATSFGVAPKSEAIVNVAFDPSLTGEKWATLTFSSNDPDEPTFVMTLRGFGLACPEAWINPSSIGDSLFTGETSLKTLILGNSGGSALNFEVELANFTEPTSLKAPSIANSASGANRYLSIWELIGYENTKNVNYDPQARTTNGLYATGQDGFSSIKATPGDVITSWPVPVPIQQAWGLGFDGHEVWLSDSQGNTDNELTPLGDLVTSFSVLSWAGSWAGDMDWDGNHIWQVNVGGDNGIYKLDPANGNVLGSIHDPSHTWDAISQRGLAYDKKTDVFYVGGWNLGTIYKIKGSSWENPGEILSSFGFPNVSGLALHPAGTLWIAVNASIDYIFQVDPQTGGIISYFIAPGAQSGYEGAGLATDKSGNIWCVSQATNRVYLVESGVKAYQWTTVAPESGIVDVGGAIGLDVKFDAAGLFGGDYSADIVITSNDCDEPISTVPVMLHVTGAPDIALSTTILDFDTTFIGTTDSSKVVISNNGTDVLEIRALTVSMAGTLDPVFSIDNLLFEVNPGEERDLQVRFTPAAEGFISGILTIECTDPDQTVVTVKLQGKGLIPPDIAVSPDSLRSYFLFNGQTETEILTISNTGVSDLNFTLTVEGAKMALASSPNHPASLSENLTQPERPISRQMVAPKMNPYVNSYEIIAKDSPPALPFRGSAAATPQSALFIVDPSSLLIKELNPTTGVVINSFAPPPGGISGGPDGLAFDGTYLYLINGYGTNQIYRLDRSTGDVIATATIAGLETIDALGHSGDALYACGYSSYTIYKIDFATASIIEQHSFPFEIGGGLTFGGNRESFFVCDFNGQIYEIGASNWQVMNEFSIPLSGNSLGLGYSQGLGVLFISSWSNNTMYAVNPDNGTVIFSYPVPSSSGIAADEAAGAGWLSTDLATGTIPSGKSLDVLVTFNATGLNGGDYGGSIIIVSNDPDEPEITYPAHLHVTDAPDISLDRDSLEFGTIYIGAAHNDTMTITNNGTAVLNISNIFTDNSDYAVGISSINLNPAQAFKLPVTFSPSLPGPITGTLLIQSNDPDEPTLEVVLQGVGLEPPDISITSDSLRDSLFIGGVSTKTLTISNTGITALSFDIKIENTGEALPKDNDAPRILVIQQTIAWGVDMGSFIQSEFGLPSTVIPSWQISATNFDDYDFIITVGDEDYSYYDDLSANVQKFSDFVSNGGIVQYQAATQGSNVSIAGGVQVLSGNREMSNLVLIPSHPIVAGLPTLLPGDLANHCYLANLPTTAHVITETSNSHAPTTVEYRYGNGRVIATGMTWEFLYYYGYTSGPLLHNAVAYSLSLAGKSDWLSVDLSTGEIAPGGSQDIAVTFDATSQVGGDYGSNLIVSSNDPDESLITLPAHLHVIDSPDITLSRDTLDFGEVFIGYPEALILTVSNDGSLTLNVANISSSRTEFSANVSSFVLSSGQSRDVEVMFSPLNDGELVAALTIVSDDPDEATKNVVLRGIGVLPPIISTAPESLMVSINEGDSTQTTLSLTNSGLGVLQWHIEGASGNSQAYNLESRLGVKISNQLDERDNDSAHSSMTINQSEVAIPPLTALLADLTGRRIGISPSYTVISSDLVARGATVKPVNFPLPADFLDSLDILTIDDYVSAATNSEVAQIREWVNKGKGLFLIGDDFSSEANIDSLIRGTGMSFTSLPSYYDALMTNILAHPTTANVDSIYESAYGAYYNVSSPAQVVVIDDQARPHAAAAAIGSGRIFVVANELPSNGQLGLADNRLFSNQIFDWLAAPSYVSVEPLSGTLASGQSQDLAVKLNASHLRGGDYRHQIEIASNAPVDNPLNVPVNLHVIGIPNIVVRADSLQFGEVYIGYPESLPLTIANIGSDPLTISNVIAGNSEYTVDLSNFTIPSDQDTTLHVLFAPSQVGDLASLLTISSNDPDDSDVQVVLSGSGLIAPVIAVNPPSLASDLFTNQTETKTMMIHNNGGSDLSFKIELEASQLLRTGKEKPIGSTHPQSVDRVDANTAALGAPQVPYLDSTRIAQPLPFVPQPYTGATSTASLGVLFNVDATIGQVTELNPIDGQLIRTIPLPVPPSGGPDGLAFDGKYLYYCNDNSSSTIYKLDRSTGAVIGMISFPSIQSIDALGHSGTHLYVLDYASYVIYKVDYESASIIDQHYFPMSIGGGITFGGNRGTLFVSTFSNYFIYEIDPNNWQILNTIIYPPGGYIYGLGYSDDLGVLLVSDFTYGALRGIDPDSGTGLFSYPLPLGSGLAGDEAEGADWLVIDPQSGVINEGDSLAVSVTFDATDLLGGDYQANIEISSNDPDEAVVTIPASMHVTGVPDILISPLELLFGGVLIGGAEVETLTISNAGTDILIVTSIFANRPEFTVSPTSFSLAIGRDTSVTVTFAPIDSGAVNSNLSINSNDPDQPTLIVSLQGRGDYPPDINVTPISLSADLTSGTAATQQLTISNTGVTDLNFDISIQEIEGGAMAAKTRPVTPLDEQNVELGDNATQTKPAATTGSALTSSHNPTPNSTRPTTGRVVLAGSYSGDHLRFGITDYGEIMPFQYPLGNEHLLFGSWVSGYTIAYLAGGTDNVVYAGYQYRNGIVPVSYTELVNNSIRVIVEVVTRTSDSRLKITQKITFRKDDKYINIQAKLENTSGSELSSVVFKSFADWDVDGNFNNDWNYDLPHHMVYASSAHYLAVAGQKAADLMDIDGWDDYLRRTTIVNFPTGPILSFDGIEVLHYELGNLAAGASTKVVTAFGAGNNLSELQSVLERGIVYSDWLSAAPISGTVPSGGSSDIVVTFNTQGLGGGAYDATIVIASNDPDEPQVIVPTHLNVTGAPDISLSPASINFGDVVLGNTRTLTLTVVNNGDATLNVTNIASSRTEFVTDLMSFSVNPGYSQQVQVTFTPSDLGLVLGGLEINSNDPGDALVVLPVQGTGVSTPQPGDTCRVFYDQNGQIQGVDLGPCDTVRLACPIYQPVVIPGDSIAIPIYLWNNMPVAGISLGFHYNSDLVEITSWSVAGGVIPLPAQTSKLTLLLPNANMILIGWIDFNGSDPIPPNSGNQGGLLGTLYMKILPGASNQVINIDSTFVPPGGPFSLSVLDPVWGVHEITPEWVDCGATDVFLGTSPPILCGDADASGLVTISDAVFVINYIFGGGPVPNPISNADANCDAVVNISDAVYLINFIFSGGAPPCSACP